MTSVYQSDAQTVGEWRIWSELYGSEWWLFKQFLRS